jgi:hypothetical protein
MGFLWRATVHDPFHRTAAIGKRLRDGVATLPRREAASSSATGADLAELGSVFSFLKYEVPYA